MPSALCTVVVIGFLRSTAERARQFVRLRPASPSAASKLRRSGRCKFSDQLAVVFVSAIVALRRSSSKVRRQCRRKWNRWIVLLGQHPRVQNDVGIFFFRRQWKRKQCSGRCGCFPLWRKLPQQRIRFVPVQHGHFALFDHLQPIRSSDVVEWLLRRTFVFLLSKRNPFSG